MDLYSHWTVVQQTTAVKVGMSKDSVLSGANSGTSDWYCTRWWTCN